MIIMDPPHIDGYEWDRKIGGGSFSSVYRALIKNPEKTAVAIKCIHRRGKKMCTDAAVKEISLMKSFKHENIVRLIDFQFDAKYIYIIMEYCSEGDLSKLLKQKHKLAESFTQTLIQQLGLALKYLRQHNVCHMDLKPQNILLTKNPKLTLKLADFGLSQILSEENIEQSRFAGSLIYMAPEKLLSQKFDARVDLWSVGIVMYELLVGRSPFGRLTVKTTLEYVHQRKSINIPSCISLSSSCEDLLFRLLKYDPNERISYEEFFNHEFMNLNFLPCTENYEHVIKLLEEATSLEQQNKFGNAMTKYKDAICFMEGFLEYETNPNQKLVIQEKLCEYRSRHKQLSEHIQNNSQKTSGLSLTSDSLFQSLCETSRGTPKLRTGLDIGSLGEMYYAEGKLDIALEKLTAALDILLQLLNNEPAGFRKDLLHKQIQKWLSLAETLKSSLKKI